MEDSARQRPSRADQLNDNDLKVWLTIDQYRKQTIEQRLKTLMSSGNNFVEYNYQ